MSDLHPRAAVEAVALDRRLSPVTGWTRAHHAALATSSLLALRAHTSPGHAAILPPGPFSAAGRDSDAFEGFARSFLGAGYLLGGGASDPHDFAGWYARGVVSGTDASSGEAWPRLASLAQPRVEAAALSIGLHETRSVVWDRLDSSAQERVIDFLSESADAWYPPGNWLLFMSVTQAFLRSVGADVNETRVADALEFMASCHLGDGWYSDGTYDLPDRPRWPQVDWYNSWVIHHFFLWYARMTPGSDDLVSVWVERLGQWADRAIDLFGADGAPLFQGRSLTYRYGMLAGLLDAAGMGVGPDPGRVRRVASQTLQHFVENDAYTPDGVLSLGWFTPHERMRQSYSGPGSPYWAMHGFSGLAFGADSPLWTSVEQPSAVEAGEVAHRVDGCHWLIHSPADDGLVRVLNHGVDHVMPGRAAGDALYDRVAFSTATAPLEHDDAELIADNEVAVECHARLWRLRVITEASLDETALGPVARSTWRAGVEPEAPEVSMVALQRGQVEVRFVRTSAADRVVVSGWPVTAGRGVVASITPLLGEWRPGGTSVSDEQPLGRGAEVAWLETDDASSWVAVAVVLRPEHSVLPAMPVISVSIEDEGKSEAEATVAAIAWPDGSSEQVTLHDS